MLVVEDERTIREGLERALEAAGFDADSAAGLAEARRKMSDGSFACVLLDIRLRDGNGLAYLAELRATAPDVPVIMTTAFSDSGRAIEAMALGAFEYVTKPFDLPVLVGAVERAVRKRAFFGSASPSSAPASDPSQGSGRLLGTSAAMLPVWKAIGRAAASDATVLITGETGTGKELVARAIHEHGRRAHGPFVAVNLASLPSTLLESELFGHERGAFTGASTRRLGRLELARDGTLFLDEIGDLEPPLQTKLLRVLAEGRFERIGGSEELRCEARIIAATHKDVRPAAGGSILREDLYYRLAVLEIELPPLRARPGDVPILVQRALEGTKARAVSDGAVAVLQRYAWPGNVRELLHVVKSAAAMCGGELVDEDDLPDQVKRATPGGVGGDEEDLDLRAAVAALEKRMIERALQRSGGNRSKAAARLGIARPQLYAKMKEHGIGVKGSAAEPEGSE